VLPPDTSKGSMYFCLEHLMGALPKVRSGGWSEGGGGGDGDGGEVLFMVGEGASGVVDHAFLMLRCDDSFCSATHSVCLHPSLPTPTHPTPTPLHPFPPTLCKPTPTGTAPHPATPPPLQVIVAGIATVDRAVVAAKDNEAGKYKVAVEGTNMQVRRGTQGFRGGDWGTGCRAKGPAPTCR
jgi:hypothetical protein